jgi:hypothetical protein
MMALIIITGILTCGAIPLFSLLGRGIEIVINVFGGAQSIGVIGVKQVLDFCFLLFLAV